MSNEEGYSPVPQELSPKQENASKKSIPDPQKEENEHMSGDKILRMMANMGYRKGLGLGRNEQGLLKPLEVKLQVGKRGFGKALPNLDVNGLQWTPEMEIVNVQEEVRWLENTTCSEISYEILKTWMVLDAIKLSMDDETLFCDQLMLRNVLKAKTILDEFDRGALQEARAKANPFETVRSAFFMNRAALKMANIDAATNFIFTDIERNPFHCKSKGPYYFADVCAGPGGFTEYILWRKKWLFKGFGLTLRGSNNDFKVNESSCASGATFQPLYGANKDGNIFDPRNIEDFRDAVLLDTDNEGVHFMMSDGGFSVEGNENLQEILSKQLYICQCLMALEIVRPHGHFVSKLFDLFTPFSVGLLYLMYLSFEKITILKPNASRPANSERYLICYGLKKSKHTHGIRKYLRKIVYKLWDLKNIQKNENEDIRYIVPMETITKDLEFMEFITYSNNRIGNCQIVALMKMAAFCSNPNLVENRQENIRIQCLAYWRIPDNPKNYIPQVTKADITTKFTNTQDIMFTEAKQLEKNDLKKIVDNFQDWYIAPMYAQKETSKCKFYAAINGSVVFKYERSRWIKEMDVNIKLVQGTILYGELVEERSLLKEELEEIESKSLHVIDALRLGDISLADLSFDERHTLIETYCQAVNFESNKGTIRIRPKIIQPLRSICDSFPIEYNICENKYFSLLPTLGYNILREYFVVNSLLLLKTTSNQSFSTTYVLRRQLFNSDDHDMNLSINEFVNYVKKCCK